MKQWARSFQSSAQDGDHLIMEMIIILLTHQMSSYPSPASNLPSDLPKSMTSIWCKYISTKICFMLHVSGKGFQDENLWALVAYVVCNVECNVNVHNIYSFYLAYGKNMCNQFEYSFCTFRNRSKNLSIISNYWWWFCLLPYVVSSISSKYWYNFLER